MADSIVIAETSVTIEVGQSSWVNYEILPEAVGDTATVYFSSSDESIVTVSEWGVMEGVKAGFATVTAEVHDKSASVEVEVIEAVIKKFKLEYNEEELPEQINVPYGGESIEILITSVSPSNANMDAFSVKSEDNEVAEAEVRGDKIYITPKNEGETTIVVKAGKAKQEFVVVVQMIHAESVVIDQENPEVGLNTTLQLTATTTPKDISKPERKWSSSDPSIISVDENGLITGLSEGSVTITVEVDGKTASKIVNVKYVKPTSVSLSASSKALVINDNFQLTATTSPAEVTFPEITWESSNASVATVDENGLVTALSEGQTTITATVDGVEGTCKIVVSKYPPIEDFDLVASNTEVKIRESVTLSIDNLQPNGAMYSDISWSIDKTNLASISVNKEEGTCTLTAKEQTGSVIVTAESNGITKTQTIQITKVAVTSVSITSDNALSITSGVYACWAPETTGYAETQYESGEDITLKATVYPSNASFANEVEWTTSSTSVTVKQENGEYKIYVAASAEGNCTITATCDGKSAEFKLHIIPKGFYPTINDVYGTTTMKQTISGKSYKSNIEGYGYPGTIEFTNATIEGVHNKTTIAYSSTEKELTLDFKDLASSSSLHYDKVNVYATILGKEIGQVVTVYNSYYGLSCSVTDTYGIEDNSSTGYQYYIQEGGKFTGCNLIGYDNGSIPKFRFETNQGKDEKYTVEVYIHYNDGSSSSASGETCRDSYPKKYVTSRQIKVGDETETFTLTNSDLQYKIDFFN